MWIPNITVDCWISLMMYWPGFIIQGIYIFLEYILLTFYCHIVPFTSVALGHSELVSFWYTLINYSPTGTLQCPQFTVCQLEQWCQQLLNTEVLNMMNSLAVWRYAMNFVQQGGHSNTDLSILTTPFCCCHFLLLSATTTNHTNKLMRYRIPSIMRLYV